MKYHLQRRHGDGDLNFELKLWKIISEFRMKYLTNVAHFGNTDNQRVEIW